MGWQPICYTGIHNRLSVPRSRDTGNRSGPTIPGTGYPLVPGPFTPPYGGNYGAYEYSQRRGFNDGVYDRLAGIGASGQKSDPIGGLRAPVRFPTSGVPGGGFPNVLTANGFGAGLLDRNVVRLV